MKQTVNQRIKNKNERKGKKKLDKVIFLGGISGVLYLGVSRYDNQILYFGYTGYLIYIPIIVAGLLLFRNFKGDYDQFFVNWFFRFMMSLMFFYVPAMTLFVFLNSLYVKDKPEKFLTVPLEKAISRRAKNARILVKIHGEMKAIYGYSRVLDNISKEKPSDYTVFMKYKEGLFDTYYVESYAIYKEEE